MDTDSNCVDALRATSRADPQNAHTDSGTPGTRLGLAICHRIIERHQGSITVRENPGDWNQL